MVQIPSLVRRLLSSSGLMLAILVSPALAQMLVPGTSVHPDATSTIPNLAPPPVAQPVNPTPIWFVNGRPLPQASEATALLLESRSHGLEPADYGALALHTAIASASQGRPLSSSDLATLDKQLTSALRRYLQELHRGRVDPHDIHERYNVPPPADVDFDALLRNAVAADQLGSLVAAAAPRFPLSESLRQALAEYRRLENLPELQAPLPPLPAKSLKSGEPYAGSVLLRQRLTALGDLKAESFQKPVYPAPVPPNAAPQATYPATVAPDSTRTVPANGFDYYDPALVQAVKVFQERHGLEPDGVIGAATFKALGVAPSQRARQIELTLERLRWTPLLQGSRMIVVNIPEFVLRAYEVHDGRVDVRAEMRIIVGNAFDTRTPLFDEDMRFIEFSPYWNVPRSIARGETIPRLRKDPAYFSRQGFEFVTGNGAVIRNLSSANLDAVSRGEMRIRQRPGPQNALGDIKFIFPNDNNIYLHHTPAPQLFERARRDFSHGCIRVEYPVQLARFVLADAPQWDETRIREAMGAGRSRTIRLEEPIPVLIAYSTVVVKNDKVYFFSDLYGHDALLDKALAARASLDQRIQ